MLSCNLLGLLTNFPTKILQKFLVFPIRTVGPSMILYFTNLTIIRLSTYLSSILTACFSKIRLHVILVCLNFKIDAFVQISPINFCMQFFSVSSSFELHHQPIAAYLTSKGLEALTVPIFEHGTLF